MIDLNKIAIIAGERYVTYSQMLACVSRFAKKTPVGRGTKTVILGENSEQWVYAFFSVWLNEGIAVPVDASSTASDVAYILSDCRPDAVWVSKDKEPVLREALELMGKEQGSQPAGDFAPKVLRLDGVGEETTSDPSEEGTFLPWTALSEPDNEETAVIIYTSGTTGSPKGVMLSYANLMANVRSVSQDVPIYNSERRALVLLPLHHVLPLMGSLIAPLYMGGGIAICPSLSGPDIMATMQRGQVGIMIGVPRLWQTLYLGIKKKIDASALTRALFSLCRVAKCRPLSRLIFRSVRKAMGGHIDYLVSGGAALEREIGEGLRTLGLDVLEGYGMTETAPMISFTRPGDYIPGCSGLPLPGMECKLVEGELCVKGPNLMKGYYNRPEETSQVIDADGFLHTGDLATFDPLGRITITGRTKEIIVLSNGKNVQPSEIEYKLEKLEEYVKEAAVVPDGDMLRAIIVPQPKWAASLTDSEVAARLKQDVLELYNRSVASYKKVMSVLVYRGELPRTRLDKLQRYKLGDILHQGTQQQQAHRPDKPEPDFQEYLLIKRFIEQEKGVKVHSSDHIETDLALDSLDKVSLQDFIERTFGTSVEVEEMPLLPNIEALARRVAAEKTRMEAEEVDWHQLLCSSVDDLTLPTHSLMPQMMSRLLKGMFLLYNRLTIRGQENIPRKGACILAPNHQSYVDGAVVLSGIRRKELDDYFFYATEDHVRSARRQRMAARSGVIVMERKSLKNSILKLAKALRQGHRIIIFPEGARTHDGNMVTFKKTFAILSRELDVPIVPVCIRGAYEALPRGSAFLRPRHIEVTFLPPIVPSQDSSYEDLTRQTQDAIEALLAPKN